MKKTWSAVWDKCGLGLSLACAVHCLLYPILSLLVLVFPMIQMDVVPEVWSHFVQGWERHDPWLWGLALVLSVPSVRQALQFGRPVIGAVFVASWSWFALVETFDWPHAWVGLSALGLLFAHASLLNRKGLACSARKI